MFRIYTYTFQLLCASLWPRPFNLADKLFLYAVSILCPIAWITYDALIDHPNIHLPSRLDHLVRLPDKTTDPLPIFDRVVYLELVNILSTSYELELM